MLEVYSGGKVDDLLSRRWCSGRVMVLKAYFDRCVAIEPLEVGGMLSTPWGRLGMSEMLLESSYRLCFAAFVACRCIPSVISTRLQLHSQEWG